MNVVYIKTNNRGYLHPDIVDLNELLNVILIDEHDTPIARNEFDSNKIKLGIKFLSNKSKICFNISPRMTYEIISSRQQ